MQEISINNRVDTEIKLFSSFLPSNRFCYFKLRIDFSFFDVLYHKFPVFLQKNKHSVNIVRKVTPYRAQISVS